MVTGSETPNSFVYNCLSVPREMPLLSTSQGLCRSAGDSSTGGPGLSPEFQTPSVIYGVWVRPLPLHTEQSPGGITRLGGRGKEGEKRRKKKTE